MTEKRVHKLNGRSEGNIQSEHQREKKIGKKYEESLRDLWEISEVVIMGPRRTEREEI